MVDEALIVSDQMKQEAFLANWKDMGLALSGPDAELYQDLSSQRVHLHAIEVVNSPNRATKQWQNWLGRFRTLCEQNKQVARLVSPVPVSIVDLTKALESSHSTIFDYVIGKDSAILFTIKSGSKISATTLPIGNKQLVGSINALLPSCPANANAPQNALNNRTLHSLYSALFPEAVRTLLPQAAEDLVVIVPDGPLDCVPFAALVDNQNKFFVSSHTVGLAPTIATLLDSPPRYTDNPTFLFAAGASNPGEQIDNIAQAKDIAQALPTSAVTYLIGEEANLKNLQEQGNGKAAIQVCGAIDLSGNALQNVLPLKAKDEQSEAKGGDLLSTTIPCDATVLNGAEVKKVEDTARNAMSAPSTLGSALRYAGARHTLVSLWPIGNEQNHVLIDFYKSELSGASPVVALRKAQLAQINRNAHPSDWASLQIFAPLY